MICWYCKLETECNKEEDGTLICNNCQEILGFAEGLSEEDFDEEFEPAI